MGSLALLLARAAAFIATTSLHEPRQGNGRAVTWLVLAIGANILTASAYFAVSAPVAKFFKSLGFFPAPLWPGAGVALFAVVVGGWTVAPGVFVGSAAANGVLFTAPAKSVMLISFTNTLGPLVGGLLLRRTFPPRHPVFLLGDVGRLLLYGVVVHAAITALGGTLALALLSEANDSSGRTFLAWMISDSAGALLIAAPAILWCIDRRVIERRHWREVALVSLLALSIGASRLILPAAYELPLGVPALVVLCSTWLVVRFYPRDATTLFAAVLMVILAANIIEPEALRLVSPENVSRFLGVAAIVGMLNVLLVGAIMEERAMATRRVAQDLLTGLPNRSAFLSVAARELDRAQSYNRPLSLVTFDVDGFRSVNARLGSLVGDAVLNAIAGHARAWLRPLDTLARIGDDEFAILMV
jgi:GGDEF domain-containing protein